MSDLPRDKTAWRAWAASQRTALPATDHQRYVATVSRFLDGLAPLDGYVLTYRPMGDEVDLDALLTRYRCAVTRTHPERADRRLTIHAADAPTERHRWGYLQPVAGAPEIDPHDIAMALVPGVVFDRCGGRLGNGAGYYDRLLPRLRAGVPLVGITRLALVVDALPVDAHDIAMTHLATEAGVSPVAPHGGGGATLTS